MVQFADFLSRPTIRKVLEFFVIAMLAVAFAQTFPIDLAILFAGDTLMYLEILVALRLAAGRGALRAMWLFTTRLAGAALRVMTFAISRSFATIRQLRQRPVRRLAQRERAEAKFRWTRHVGGGRDCTVRRCAINRHLRMPGPRT